MNLLRYAGLSLLICQFAVLLAPSAHADYAVLRAGQRLHISGYLRQGSRILLYVGGGSVLVDSADVVRFEPEDTFTPAPPGDATKAPFAAQIRAAAEQNGVDAKLVSSVIAAESNFDSRAVSPKHAMGLMQLMP
ncbi:MAG TPA: transglycosylase SLT domain-containing protein, partial [Candidatus Acidoferrales bacterium]|nr:transglycosylase SLT domain-containing protein [Candidatus Acidoferrales bacterium]